MLQKEFVKYVYIEKRIFAIFQYLRKNTQHLDSNHSGNDAVLPEI